MTGTKSDFTTQRHAHSALFNMDLHTNSTPSVGQAANAVNAANAANAANAVTAAGNATAASVEAVKSELRDLRAILVNMSSELAGIKVGMIMNYE